MTYDDAVAVIGAACRYPGAGDVAGYWDLLRTGREGITRFTPAELLALGADPELVRQPAFVPAKGVLAGSADFDWAFFGYSRAEAASMDPQHRVFLECASAAVDDAGIDPTRFPGWIGVYAGADRTNPRPDAELSPLARLIGEEKDFLATRVAYKLSLRGPAVTVQTACSTSLVAVHMAVRSLLGGECDVALAGGVAVSPRGEYGYLHEPGGPLSPDGHCRPFDALAAGTVPGEGVGVVVLKRLADALRDDDRIAAVVLGSALNNDGGEKMGFTAPSIPGQSDVIRYAHKVAEIDPADIDHVEAHGTATPMGDPVEVAALTDAFRMSTCAVGSTFLGAVKSNLGHTSAAAGVASFLKTVLMLEHRELVPTLHYETPNPLLDLDASPFRISTRTAPWPDRGTPLAAVSSFGVGGTNAHVVLQGPPRRDRPAGGGLRVLGVSAATPQALDRLRGALADRLAAPDAPALPDVARTLADRRAFPHRSAVTAADAAAAERALRSPAPVRSRLLGRVAFLFPGHGTLRGAAGGPAYRRLAGFRSAFDEVADAARSRCGVDLAPVIEPGAPPAWYEHGAHHQLGLFALGYALGRELGDRGIVPAAMFGNSIGEYAPAALAGIWTPGDAAVVVHRRAEAIWATQPGRMLAVDAPEDEVARRIAGVPGVSVSVVGRGGVVLSGSCSDIDALVAGDVLVGLETRPLNVTRAGHSAAMTPAAELLRPVLAGTPAGFPTLPMVSDATGDWADPDALTRPDYWVEQLSRPVLLDRAMDTLLDADCDTFLELGPGASMLGALRWNSRWKPEEHVGVPLLGRTEDGEEGLLTALGSLWGLGVDVLDVAAPGGMRCALPPHPFTPGSPEAPRPVVPRTARAVPARSVTPEAGQGLRSVLAELWTRALGVPVGSDDDHFFRLGGESLVALNLTTRIRESTGRVVPLAEFVREPTFGRLLALAEAGRPAAAVSVPALTALGASTLREGTGRPVFLAADAVGTALSYQALADALNTGRPVIGLEPVATGTRTSVGSVAAAHLHAVLAVQPEGPYTLGGWSFGAIVAHELAWQLVDRGAEVDLLVCLDAYVPGRRGLPVGLSADFLAGQALVQAGAAFGLGAVGAQVRRNPALRRLFVDKFRVLAPYRPLLVPCAVVVAKVGVDRAGADRIARRLAPLYGGPVRVHPVPGDHWSLLAEPDVGGLAAVLRPALTPDSAAPDLAAPQIGAVDDRA